MPLLPQLSQPARPNLLGSTGTQRIASEDIGRLRETIPVPILPKLARMYITTRQAHDRQVPPLPPPTADYLVRSRPPPSISAPSYDELCSQIMDVQRQYTCGTSKDRGISPGKARVRSMTFIKSLFDCLSQILYCNASVYRYIKITVASLSTSFLHSCLLSCFSFRTTWTCTSVGSMAPPWTMSAPSRSSRLNSARGRHMSR